MTKEFDKMWFVSELWLQEWDKIKILLNKNAIISKIGKKEIIIEDVNDTKYYIKNITHLLDLLPKFENNTFAQTIINMISNSDKSKYISYINKKWLSEVLKSWKYIILNNKIWYHSIPTKIRIDEWYKNIPPAVDYVTDDIGNFVVLNEYFSKDSEYIYYTNEKLRKSFKNIETTKAIWDSHYAYDKANVYYGSQKIPWAYITNDDYKIIKWYYKDRSGDILVDSCGNCFYGVENIKTEHSNKLRFVKDNFISDGVNIYFLAWWVCDMNDILWIPISSKINYIEDLDTKVDNELCRKYIIWGKIIYCNGVEFWREEEFQKKIAQKNLYK